eukprot:COSAG01_NODE_720_length_14070_cov_9.960633_16_plen_204_part_00
MSEPLNGQRPAPRTLPHPATAIARTKQVRTAAQRKAEEKLRQHRIQLAGRAFGRFLKAEKKKKKQVAAPCPPAAAIARTKQTQTAAQRKAAGPLTGWGFRVATMKCHGPCAGGQAGRTSWFSCVAAHLGCIAKPAKQDFCLECAEEEGIRFSRPGKISNTGAEFYHYYSNKADVWGSVQIEQWETVVDEEAKNPPCLTSYWSR